MKAKKQSNQRLEKFLILDIVKKEVTKSKKNQLSDKEFTLQLFSYIGLEFEKIGLSYLASVFPGAEIQTQTRMYPDPADDTKYIVPDATIQKINKHQLSILTLKKNSLLFLDFKRSFTAISKKDVAYLKLYPEATLLICFLRDYHNHAFRDKRIKKYLNEIGIKNQVDIRNYYSRIIFWNVNDEFKSFLSKKKKFLLENDIRALNQKDSIKNIVKISRAMATDLVKLGNQELDKECDFILSLDDPYLVFKLLLTLQVVVYSKYLTNEDISEKLSLSTKTTHDQLMILFEIGTIKRKRFFDNRPYYYYYRTDVKPTIADYLSIHEKKASNGLNLLIKSNFITKTFIVNANFDELNSKLKIRNDIDISIIHLLAVYATFNSESILVPHEISHELNITQKLSRIILGKLNKLKLLESYRIQWESTVLYYRLIGRGPAPFSSLIKYLPELTAKALNFLQKNKSIVFKGVDDLRKIIGPRWIITLQIFSIMNLKKESYPDGYTPKELLYELINNNIILPFHKIRKSFYSFSIHPLNLIVIERINYGNNGKIKRFILEEQNKIEFNRIRKQQNKKKQQLKSGTELIKSKTGRSVEQLKEDLGDGWTVKIQIYYILAQRLGNDVISVENIIKLLNEKNILLSRQYLLKYLTPFSREPFNLVKIERTKKGDNSPIKSITFL